MMGEAIRDIDKEEVARWEIVTAIRMHFANQDAVCIHVLAMSALNILQDVCDHMGITSMQAEREKRVREEKKREFRIRRRAAYNFFHHADRDPQTKIDHFDDRLNDYILYESCVDFTTAYKTATSEIAIYRAWFSLVYADILLIDRRIAQHFMRSFGRLEGESRPVQKQRGLDALLRQSNSTQDHFIRLATALYLAPRAAS